MNTPLRSINSIPTRMRSRRFLAERRPRDVVAREFANGRGREQKLPILSCAAIVLFVAFSGCRSGDTFLNRPESSQGTEASGTSYVPSMFGASSPRPSVPPESVSPATPTGMVPVYPPQAGLVQPSGYAGTPGGTSQLSPEVAAAQAAGAGNGTTGNFGAAGFVAPNGTVSANGVASAGVNQTPNAGILPSGYVNNAGQISPYTPAAGATPSGTTAGGMVVPAGYTAQQAYAATPPGYTLMAPVQVVNPVTGARTLQYMAVRPAGR